MPAAGSQPNAPLLQASDGNFYGTTRAGGTSGCSVGCGVLFKVTPGGVATAIHAFGDKVGDGERPTAPLIQGRDGALYGTTSFGGAHGSGTVFKVTLDRAYSVLYSFGSSPSDGRVPASGLIQASDGNFYGTTTVGGVNQCSSVPGGVGNCGTVYKITPGGAETVLYSFGTSASDGVQPQAPLVQGSDGNFYGTTVNGGANSCSNSSGPDRCGTVYKITPGGNVTILHSFGGGTTPGFLPVDGVAPQGPLIQGTDGAFYGTTVAGGQGRCGNAFGCGTVYRITAAGTLTILHAFATESSSDGDGPAPFLMQARDGNFYGMTISGGAYFQMLSYGTIFRLTPDGIKTTLYSFAADARPANPLGGLIQGADGALYGLTSATLFRFAAP